MKGHPSIHAQNYCNKPAIIIAETGQSLSYGELDKRSNQVAQLLRASQVASGDVIGIFLHNSLEFLELVWGAQRSGVTYVLIASHLQADELSYILNDAHMLPWLRRLYIQNYL